MLAGVPGASLLGIQGFIVEVEADVAPGLPGFHMVGMPATAVREAKKRVRAAMRNAGLRFPLQRITVNLAPADHPKEGSQFDLPIAVAILLATGQWRLEGERPLFVGELALDGAVRPVRGVLPMALAAREAGIATVVLPAGNLAEAAQVEGLSLRPLRRLQEGPLPAAADGRGAAAAAPAPAGMEAGGAGRGDDGRGASAEPYPRLREIVGHAGPKRALTLAAAGGHHLMMLGPPGVGKTLLARALARLMPPLTDGEALEVSAVYSAAGRWAGRSQLMRRRPFRAPHPNITPQALIGGGRWPAPGELSLAHLGVLLLDEAPSFGRQRLDLLRAPLERGAVRINRVRGSARLPCRVTLVLAANPCPCGLYGDGQGGCRCTAAQVARYQRRLSGPLLDRIDLQVEVHRPARPTWSGEHGGAAKGETERARARSIARARQRQEERAGRLGLATHTLNARLGGSVLEERLGPDPAARQLLDRAYRSLRLSLRSYHSILRMAQTITDLEPDPGDLWAPIGADAVAEALQYRGFDRMLI